MHCFVRSVIAVSVCAALAISAQAQTARTPHPAATEEAESGPAVELDPYVVTGTRTAQRLSEVPVRTELVTRGELAPQHPRTLADAVEFITGVRVENNCQNCNFS